MKIVNAHVHLIDVKGMVEISVEGITKENQIFKSSKTIEVKQYINNSVYYY